jgi:hypothetical protein
MSGEMPRWRIFLQGALLAWTVATVGCGRGRGGAPSETVEAREAPSANESQPSESKASAIQVLELKSYTLDQLPAVRENEALERLDGGHLTVAPPGDWQTGSKQPKMVCRFFKTDSEGLPRIIIRSDATAGEIKNVTADNVVAYAEEVASALEAEKNKLQENLRPLVLGNNGWVRYVKKASYRNQKVDLQVLQTVRDGRTYYVDLQVLAGELTETEKRDAAYAVAATMKFLTPAGDSPASE